MCGHSTTALRRTLPIILAIFEVRLQLSTLNMNNYYTVKLLFTADNELGMPKGKKRISKAITQRAMEKKVSEHFY